MSEAVRERSTRQIGFAALGGVLIALGGYGALGLGLPLFAFAAAALAWWPTARSASDRLPV